MKITTIKVDNYRLLKEFEISLEDNLSLIIGKNNCGKTSLLSVLEKFILSDQNNFSFDDINLTSQKEIQEKITTSDFDETLSLGIKLRIYIEYSVNDNLANISSFMLNLSPTSNIIILGFEYILGFEDAIKLKNDFENFKLKLPPEIDRDLFFFLRKNHTKYFRLYKKALEHQDENNWISVEKKDIDKVINFKRIQAKRGVINPDGTTKKSDKTLSKLSSDYFEKVSNKDLQNEHADELRNKLSLTDLKLNEIYENLFEGVINKIARFGGIKESESIIKIISQLEERNILKENTAVMYNHSSFSLPEDYNGLGYMNLIAMIFEIEVVINDFKKKRIDDEIPSDINLFFIEEPEAHTHPQMQYIFINNIKTILEEETRGDDDNVPIQMQTIISTHSPHITAESDFDDIKYFYKESENTVIAKNLKDLNKEYDSETKHYHFLKQYLTLTKAELFFADKAIIIEGDTERILLPTVMKKIDYDRKQENIDNNLRPLITQNISIVEVGAYSQIFEKFINFLGIKTLIITDFDTVNATGHACPVASGIEISNSAIKFFFGSTSITELITKDSTSKSFSKREQEDGSKKWVQDADGLIHIVFQTPENGFHGRSFEDSFINVNSKFINDNIDKFEGLKNIKYFKKGRKTPYYLASHCIKKKTYFALDIIFHSNEFYSNWTIPSYIKNGLLWLQK